MGNTLRSLAICGWLTFLLAAAPPAQAADMPSAVDQYLEVVPSADGDQLPSDFSRSFGGSGGPVTRRQVITAARANAARTESSRRGSDRPRSDLAGSEDTPGTLAAFGNAKAGGSALSGLWAPLLAIVLATGMLALVMRRQSPR